jgi:endonuclease/exonuclease/phosphatase family metal-dependent hydrolase
MKLVSWNCKFGFTEQKAEYIKKYNADLYIIQECFGKDFNNINKIFKNYLFFCDDLDSKYGVGIFSDKFEFQILPEHNQNFRYIVPYKIFNNDHEFVLFSIWTKDKDENKKKIEYTEQTWKAINFEGYKKYLLGSTILVGDFNSNNFWNKEYNLKKVHSHNDIIEKLREYNIESAYHKFYNCINGNEKDPTLLWQMDKNKKFHIDYCFISNNYELKNVTIGSISEWERNKLSDHCTLIIELK